MKPVFQSKSPTQYFIIFVIQISFVLLFLSYTNFKKNTKTSDCSTSLLSSEIEPDMVVLLWARPFGSNFPLNVCEKEFSSPRCFITANRSWYPRSKAVIFHHRDVCTSRQQMPQMPRPEGQYWVWFNLESPSHSPNLGLMDNLINLTMSYRSDSDIFTPYGWLQKNELKENYSIPKKSKLVAWAVSNWNPNSKRVKFYDELKKHIHVDIYGNQRLPLPRDHSQEVLSQYKFYLSFENSIHTDYITEKLWSNAFSSGTVPVVLGPPRENYERYIPSDSFIHVDDYPSAKELANYLLELDKNNQMYEKYFNWRKKLLPVSDSNWNTHICKACVALHNAPSYRTKPHLTKWYT